MALMSMGLGSNTCVSTRSHHPNAPPPFAGSLPSLLLFPSSSSPQAGARGRPQVARARKGLSSRTRRLEKRERKGGGSQTTKPQREGDEGESGMGGPDDTPPPYLEGEMGGVEMSTGPMPELPGQGPTLFVGPRWDALGFFVQYLWAFGIAFALIACGIAVATYNEGATDFKQTPVYKESIQSQELLEEPDSSTSDVFEGNPTEVAPSLE